MRRAALEYRNARFNERIGSEGEQPDEPGQVDEVPGAGVLHVARERQRVELLGNVLGGRSLRLPAPRRRHRVRRIDFGWGVQATVRIVSEPLRLVAKR